MQNEYVDTALMAACGEGHAMVTAVLIEKGALVNYKNKVSPLSLRYSVECQLLSILCRLFHTSRYERF